jgi:hypothetical protein
MSLSRKIAALVWFALPVATLAWHYGPGQKALARDDAARALSEARAAIASGQPLQGADRFARALANLHEGDPARPGIELEQAEAQIAGGQMIEGIEGMQRLLQRLAGDDALARATRSALGEAHFHAAWLMRLEGASSDEWMIEADTARQHFRLLTESGKEPGEIEASARNLEATVRLQRLDLSELQGLALPKRCPRNCDSLSQRKRKQRESRCDKPQQSDKKKPNLDDVRQEMRQQREKDAGSGARGEGGS